MTCKEDGKAHQVVDLLNELDWEDVFHILYHLCDHQLENMLMMIADIIRDRGEEKRQIISKLTPTKTSKGASPCH